MSKHKQPGGIWTAQYAHCALDSIRNSCDVFINFMQLSINIFSCHELRWSCPELMTKNLKFAFMFRLGWLASVRNLGKLWINWWRLEWAIFGDIWRLWLILSSRWWMDSWSSLPQMTSVTSLPSYFDRWITVGQIFHQTDWLGKWN